MNSLSLFLLLLPFTFALPKLGIHGGHPVKLGQYPYQVAIRECNESQEEIFGGFCLLRCGGTLISPTWVLTAAYCLEHYEHKMNILVGTLNITEPGQSVNAKRSISHPNYAKEDYMSGNNIGLIELEKPVNINQYVNIAKLPSSKVEPAGEMVISGWGGYKTIDEHNREIFSDILLAGEVDVANDTKECVNEFNKISSFPLTSTSEKYICTRPNDVKETTNVCWGDIGGPLAKNGTVYGVTLFGFGFCNKPHAPGINVKVADHFDWITKFVKDFSVV